MSVKLKKVAAFHISTVPFNIKFQLDAGLSKNDFFPCRAREEEVSIKKYQPINATITDCNIQIFRLMYIATLITIINKRVRNLKIYIRRYTSNNFINTYN